MICCLIRTEPLVAEDATQDIAGGLCHYGPRYLARRAGANGSWTSRFDTNGCGSSVPPTRRLLPTTAARSERRPAPRGRLPPSLECQAKECAALFETREIEHLDARTRAQVGKSLLPRSALSAHSFADDLVYSAALRFLCESPARACDGGRSGRRGKEQRPKAPPADCRKTVR